MNTMPTCSVILGTVVLYVAAKRKLRQLEVPLNVHWLVNPRKIERIHRIANCVQHIVQYQKIQNGSRTPDDHLTTKKINKEVSRDSGGSVV